MIDQKTINLCKKNNRLAQREVYDYLCNPLYFTCKRYLKREEEIDDVLAESFYIIFTKIHQLKETAAFEA